jgi:gliding motility-associated lipoprotein GldH
MRTWAYLILLACLCFACDTKRFFEKNEDLKDERWVVSDKPSFEFVIEDTSVPYDLYCNIRNEVSYPKSNIYITYYLSDSTGKQISTALVSEFLFDKKTGEPFGKSGLGDIYDHRIPLLKNYTFKNPAKYKITFEQFMRKDTLEGVLAVGLRIDKPETK